MISLYSPEVLSGREREIRQKVEQERRLRAERTRDDPYGMDAEIVVLIERGRPEAACCDCQDERTRAAG